MPTEDRLAEITFTSADVQAGVGNLVDNGFLGVEELDRAALVEIVELVLFYATKGIKEEAYRAGREDAARALEAEADDEAQRPGRAEPSELIERWLREAARIAREGSSLKRSSEGEDQDTPECREDQND